MTDVRDEPIGDTAAAELALGLLDGEERAGALRRVLAEPPFAAEVDRWRGQFALLVPYAPEVSPPAALLARIETSLDGDATSATPAVTTLRRGWLWPSVAGLTSIAAAALLALLVIRPLPTPIAPPPPRTTVLLAAAITPSGTGEPVSAVFDPDAGTLRVSAAALADARHSAELWVIGGDGVPHSLGLLRASDRTALTLTAVNRARLGPAAVLAVSVEPIGGSRTGLPTGPVVAKGTLTAT